MRTIRVELREKNSPTGEVVVSTEAIVADDAEAAQAGRDARAAMDDFMTGYAEEPS